MRRRLLFLTDVELLPPDQGMRVRVLNLLTACARDHAVTLLAPPPGSAAERDQIESLCQRVVWLPTAAAAAARANGRRWWQAARTAPGLRRPVNVRGYLPFIEALAPFDPGSFPLLWAERPHIARLLHRFRRRTILDLDDLEHRRLSRAGAVAPPTGARARLEHHYRYRLYRHLELRWARDFLATVVCSDDDRDYLRAEGVANAVVIPNAVNTSAVGTPGVAAPRNDPGELRVAFLGNLRHPPNRDAVEHLGDAILPALAATGARVAVDVLGPAAAPDLVARFAGRLRFLGYVPDLGTALAGYDALAAPVRYGSGTRVKLLDAMACAIPIVTTRAGAEGLPVRDGVEVLLAETPAEFAAALVRIKADPALAARLVAAGRALVDGQFRASAVQARAADWLASLPGAN